MSVFTIVALIFVTTPTDVQAQTYDPVFYYYLPDHLGSSSVMTDRNGVMVEHYEYTAFGFAKCSTGSAFQVCNRYTGQVFDEETGLYYYNSRYYDPELGRFIQPDTIVPSPGNPQTLNRYNYVNNNPLKYVDPSGHIAVETAIIIGVVVGAAVGAAAAAAQGASGSGIALAAGLGALGGLFGGVGAWAGGAIGAAASGASTAALAAASTSAAVGTFIGAVAGGAAGGAVSAAVTGGDIGMGALAGGVSGAIGFGVGQLGFSDPGTFGQYLANAGLSAAGGAAGGAAGAALSGGDPGLGAAYGAAGGFAGYWLAAGSYALFKPNPRGSSAPARELTIDDFPGRALTAAEAADSKIDFPNLNVDEVKITGEATGTGPLSGRPGEYNCIAWSLGKRDASVWPGSGTVSDFDALYAANGYKVVGTAQAKIALFAGQQGPTHAARHLVGPWWTSKLGNSFQIVHKLNQLEGGFYGNVIRYYGDSLLSG